MPVSIEPQGSTPPLLNFAKNVTSQFGEDGIIEEIFRRIIPRTRTCIEFGAWDGKHLSNTYHLWHNQGWRALLIEGDAERCEQLRQRVEVNPSVTVLNAFVEPGGDKSLDSLVKLAAFPQVDIDLLCIDIDGDDYHILCSLKDIHPRVLIVEYNPTIPPHLDLFQTPGGTLGSSGLAITRAAAAKGYKLACMTDSNCIFVHATEFQRLGVPEFDPIASFPKDHLTYVVSDYRGQCYLTAQPVYVPAFPSLKLGDVIGMWWRSRSENKDRNARADSEGRLKSVHLVSGNNS